MTSSPRPRPATHRKAQGKAPPATGRQKPAGPAGDDSGRGRAGSDLERPTGDAPARATLENMLTRAAEGDQAAWRGLVETYSGRVFGLIRAQCNNTDLAEEITQSTFCTVVAKIGEYTEVGRFEHWLFRIAMNRLRDEMRRRKRQARPVEDEALHALADAAGGGRPGAGGPGGRPERQYAGIDASDSEQFRALRRAMTQLSETDQHIIHLRHNAGLSFKEIAEVLEQPLGTVLARQHRALKKLAEVLKGTVGQEPSIGKVRRSPGPPGGGGLEPETG